MGHRRIRNEVNIFVRVLIALGLFFTMFFLPYDILHDQIFFLAFIIFGIPIIFLATTFWLNVFEECYKCIRNKDNYF